MSDDLFHLIPDVQVVLRNRGVYRQAKLYHRRRAVYAGWGSGFIKLLPSGNTSVPNACYDKLPEHDQIVPHAFEIRYLGD